MKELVASAIKGHAILALMLLVVAYKFVYYQ